MSWLPGRRAAARREIEARRERVRLAIEAHQRREVEWPSSSESALMSWTTYAARRRQALGLAP